mmetsp:Transcript_21018/g.26537  ORF Transcript_21018/g.26537 Transcript_21018/m.26537 type:complete len:458 (+) Transcript_21018:143-1516(+)
MKYSRLLLVQSLLLATNTASFIKLSQAFVSSPQKPLYSFQCSKGINSITSSSCLNALPTEKRPLASMLDVSQLIYQYVYIRRMVQEHESTVNGNDKKTEEEKKSIPIIEFDTPALVVTDNAAGVEFKKSKLKHVITAAAIREFLTRNRAYVKEDKGGDLTFDETGKNKEITKVEEKLRSLEGRFNADIIEYDDSYVNNEGLLGLGSELLYSVVVNRSDGRITVCFRGTALSDGKKDAFVDLRACRVKPDKDFDELSGKSITLHKGFYNYLFKQKQKSDGETKFEHICDLLEEVYNYKEKEMDYSDYSLYVTGHSLGGALAQLFAFAIAGTKRAQSFLPKGKPIIAVTYASPEVGNKGYQTYFNELEKNDQVRHLRVSNKGDLVPFGLGLLVPGYKQPGVNIHVVGEEKEPDIAYDRTKIAFAFANPLDMHSPNTYRNRLPNHIIEKSAEDFYSDFDL